MNLSEAFKRLELLDEDVFNLTKDGLEDLKDFEEDSDDKEEVIDVMDPDAESEEDLEDSYIGKVILDCEVCHTDIYKDKEDITIDEETQLANVGEECPYCFSNEGFTIIGEVKPFVETTFETDDDVDVEIDGEEVEENESLRKKKMSESVSKRNRRSKKLNESKRLCEWSEPDGPFANICSIDEWKAFENGEMLFDLDSEEMVNLDEAKANKLPNCIEYDNYEDYGEKVKNGMVAFLMYDPGEEYHYVYDESLQEDTVKQGKYWVNKGDEGTHGKFRTKKAADEQRKAMFARGYKAESMRKSLKRSKKLNEGYNEDINRIYQQLKIFMDRKGYDVTDHDTLQYLAAVAEYIGMSDEEYPVAEWYRDTKMNYPEELAELKLKESLKESCSINQCQKWVDYDMKKYKKISNDTMEKIKSSGYSVVKDQYGDYEVIADRKDMDEGIFGNKGNSNDNYKFFLVVNKPGSDGWKVDSYASGMKTSRTKLKKRAEEYSDAHDGNIITKIVSESDAKKIDKNWKNHAKDLDKDKKYNIEESISIRNRKPRKIEESIEDITIDTGDQEITVSAKDKEKIESDGEMIAPVSDETKDEIEMDSEENKDSEDVDIDEFSEEEFDDLGESYLKKVYENVESYKTTSAKINGNKLYLEGLIKFNSGKSKKTSFIFESKTLDKNNKAKFIGENVQISRGHKSFKLTGTLNNNKFIAESLNYNYKAKDGSGNSKRIYGTVKVK